MTRRVQKNSQIPLCGHMSTPATRSLTKSGPCQIQLHGPTSVGLVWLQTKSVHVETERTSLRPDKLRGLVGDPSGPWVWSGRVRVVEFRNDTTRHDQRQSLVGPRLSEI